MVEKNFFESFMGMDEYVLWSGKPSRIHYFSKQDLITIPFSLFWLGFSLFWEWQVIQSRQSLFLVLWGMPFVMIGVYLLLIRPFHQASIIRHSYYVITNKQLMIKQGKKISFYTASQLPPVSLKVHRDGTASLYFYETYYQNGRNRMYSFGLKNIEDYLGAQNALRQLQEKDKWSN